MKSRYILTLIIPLVIIIGFNLYSFFASRKAADSTANYEKIEWLEGRWEIVEKELGDAKRNTVITYIEDAQMMKFGSDNSYSYGSGSVEIGDARSNEWSLSYDKNRIAIDDEIFNIALSKDKQQLTLTKPEEKVTITLKRW